MKQVIKFRAWDNKGRYMLDSSYGNWVSFDGVMYEESSRKYDTPNIEIEKSKDLTLMQFTGLKDRNGIDIYEGDIMQHSNPFDVPFVVNWDDESCGFDFNNGSTGYVINDSSFVVIGNIYQNPELLNLKENK